MKMDNHWLEKNCIEYYQIKAVIDDRTSAICERLHGTVFPIQRAIDYKNGLLSLTDPEQIKEFSPWYNDKQVESMKNIQDSDLPAGLSLPPYHANCRTTIVAYFS